VPVLHFILLTAVAHGDLKPVYTRGHAVSKKQQNRSTKRQNRTKFITYIIPILDNLQAIKWLKKREKDTSPSQNGLIQVSITNG
jgi:hypothetical protein